MNHIDTEWMPPDIREDLVSIFVEDSYCLKDAEAREDMRKTISYQVDTEPRNEWIVVRWEVPERWISEWYEESRLPIRHPDIRQDNQHESDKERIPPEYEEGWCKQCRKCEEVDDSPRYPLCREKSIGNNRYTHSQESKEESSLQCTNPYMSPTATIQAQVERYASKCYEEYGNSFSEVPPPYLREVQNISLKKCDKYIIGMKKYHPYDGNSSQSIDASESMIHMKYSISNSWEYVNFIWRY